MAQSLKPGPKIQPYHFYKIKITAAKLAYFSLFVMSAGD